MLKNRQKPQKAATPSTTTSKMTKNTLKATTKKVQKKKQSLTTTSQRSFVRKPIRLVRRGQVTDRRPNLATKGIMNEIAETIFLSSPASYVKPEHSLHDQFLRIRLQHWDQFRIDNPDMNLPEVAPYETDRIPSTWPQYEKYCKKSEEAKGPLIFYRKSHLRYDEPSFIHVVRVRDQTRSAGYGRSTILTAWHTWRGVTHAFPKMVQSRRKKDWRRLDPSLGFMTPEIWAQLQKGEIKPYYLPRPLYLDNSFEPDFMAREKIRHDDLIESTRSKVV